METTLTNFMLETILKLQSLTDMKVFLLVESNLKRRYCGSKALTDAFEGGSGLVFSPQQDVSVSLDSRVNSLVEAAPPPQPQHSFMRENEIASWPGIDKTPTSSRDLEGPTASKRKRTIDSASSFDNISSVVTKVALPACKKEEEIQEFVISDDEEDEIAENFSPIGNGAAEIDFQIHGFSSRTPQTADGLVRGGGFPPPTDGSSSSSSSYHVVDPLSFLDALPEVELELNKFNALMSVKDPTLLYQKETVESKLLRSVCYSVGKNAALKCPYSLSSQDKVYLSYFSQQCDIFISQCANAGLILDKKQITESLDLVQKSTPIGYIRHRIRDGFKRIARKYQTGQSDQM